MKQSSLMLDVLKRDIKAGQLNAVDKAKEANLLNEILPIIVNHIHIRTALMLQRASDLGGDFSVKDSYGNSLLHLLAESQPVRVDTPYYHAHLHEYYAWAIALLLKKGLNLSDNNGRGQNPKELAHIKDNQAFLVGGEMAIKKIQEPEQIMRCPLL